MPVVFPQFGTTGLLPLHGLARLMTWELDAAAGGVEAHADLPQVDFPGGVNRIYFDTPAEARIQKKDRIAVAQKAGFADAVVWNPGAAQCATIADLGPEDYHDL